jgi:hypothetical protein
MSKIEREFARQVDELILGASEQTRSKLAELDKKTQLGGKTFYDVYLSLTQSDRKQILLSNYDGTF